MRDDPRAPVHYGVVGGIGPALRYAIWDPLSPNSPIPVCYCETQAQADYIVEALNMQRVFNAAFDRLGGRR